MDLKNIAIILCAGKGSRMGRSINDKTLVALNGKPVLLYSIEAFMRSKDVDKIIIVYKDNIQKDKI